MTVRYIQSALRALNIRLESTFETDPGSSYSRIRNAQEITWTPDQTKYPVEPQKSSEMRGPDMSVSGGKGGTISWKVPLNTKGVSDNTWPLWASTILGNAEPPFDYEYTTRKLATITTPVSSTTFTIPSSSDFIVGRPVIHKPTVQCTLNGTTNKVEKVGHGLSNGDTVRLFSSGTLPTELSTAVTYYVVNKGTDDFQLALTSGGSAIDFTGSGTGTHYYYRTGSLRWITRIQDAGGGNSTITVNRAFAITPAAGHSVEYSASIQPTSGPVKTFTIHAYGGQGSTNIFRLKAYGCSITFKLATTGPKALPMIEFTAQVSSWAYDESSLTQTSLTENAPVSILGGLLYIDGVAVATRSIGFDPGMQIAEMESLDANGRSGWNCSSSVPKIEVSVLHDTTWLDRWLSDSTSVSIEFNRFVDSENCWGFWIPKAQIVKAAHEDVGGILDIKPEILVVDPEANADSAFYPLWNFAMCGN